MDAPDQGQKEYFTGVCLDESISQHRQKHRQASTGTML
jgi:hypothetical protein